MNLPELFSDDGRVSQSPTSTVTPIHHLHLYRSIRLWLSTLRQVDIRFGKFSGNGINSRRRRRSEATRRHCGDFFAFWVKTGRKFLTHLGVGIGHVGGTSLCGREVVHVVERQRKWWLILKVELWGRLGLSLNLHGRLSQRTKESTQWVLSSHRMREETELDWRNPVDCRHYHTK